MKIKKQIICFNCGEPIDKKVLNSYAKEHIPMQGLYTGYGDEYKVNRITVDCCWKCNNGSSSEDEVFRNLIGAISNDPKASAITKNTLHSMLNLRKEYHNIYIDPLGGPGASAFDPNILLNYQRKVFRALYFHQYRKILPLEYQISPGLPGEELRPVLPLVGYLEHNFKYKHSGHPDIFQYILQPFRENYTNESKMDLVPNHPEYFVAVFIYHKVFTTVVLAAPSLKN